MSKVSPFVIQKTIIGIGGESKSVKRLRSGDLLIEANSALQTKSFLLAKSFLNSPVTISPHKTLNSCRGVISETDLLSSPEPEILEGFSNQGVIQSDSKLCSKWKLEKKIQEIKTNKNASYPEARKLEALGISQTRAQSSSKNTATQIDESITKILPNPLHQLLPSTSSVTVISPSKSQPPNSVIHTVLIASHNLSISAASSSSIACSVLERTTTTSNTIPTIHPRIQKKLQNSEGKNVLLKTHLTP
ncbi:uncharacterized protein TNCV_3261101 [Trichonephila clavipes]|nr:uncharacterized protein TNCV_3261101 [Trichonephila clavipes]